MRYSRTLLAAALALSAAACGTSASAPTEPASNAPAGPSFGVTYGGGQRSDTSSIASGNAIGTGGTTSTNTAAADTSTIAGPGSGESRGVSYGGGQ